MGITFSNGSIVIDNMQLSFTDIYNASVNNRWNVVSKNGTKFQIDANIILQNSTYLYDTSKTITVTGNLFQVPSGCTLRLGEKYSATSTGNGCSLLLPNILFEYGFGGLNPNDSGNLLCYGSTIEAYGYWSFFKGNNVVELIKATITGYGKISGSSSIVTTVTFKKAHGKYGILKWDETIFGCTGMIITATDDYEESQNLPNLDTGVVALDATGISVNYGDYYGHSDLLYVLDNRYNLPITLYGSIVTNGYNLNFTIPNRNTFKHKFKFKPRIQDAYGTVLYNAHVIIRNRLGEIEFDGVVDGSGYVSTWLTHYQCLAGQGVGEILTPHTIEISHADKISTTTVYVDGNMLNIPLTVNSQQNSTVDVLTRLGLQEELNISNDEVINRVDNLDSLLRQLVESLGDKVSTTTQTVKYKNGIKFTI